MAQYTKIYTLLTALIAVCLIGGCTSSQDQQAEGQLNKENNNNGDLANYTDFTLKADMSQLTDNQQQIVSLLIDASKQMDEVFWKEAYGSKEELMNMIEDSSLKQYAQINYGPWDRLDNNRPFVDGVGSKPLGANFYPADMTKEEFEKWESDAKKDLYTLVRRSDDGSLTTIPYHEAFAEQHKKAAEKLKAAADLAKNEGLKTYLNARAEALLSGNYRESDLAWMDMRDNLIGLVIGPIETYEDQLFGYKASHESYVLIKDKEWSKRLEKYAEMLPELQKGLPVEEKYKQEEPGAGSDLNAYNVIYYAGSANAGSKTIAINLPNDEEIQLKQGTRRLQLENAMRAKYDKILVPISKVLMAEDQQQYLTFDAFFANTMFHEVAHGLGIKNTITGEGTVRGALKEYASALEEGKADVLGLYMIAELRKDNMIDEGRMKDNYVTFMASIFRSIRFGSSNAHGMANLIRFNYFKSKGAFTYDEKSKTYSVDFDKMDSAADSLSNKILTLQGDGDYEGVAQFVNKYGEIGDQLQQSLNRLSEQSIPVDVTFNQGKDVLGLE